MNTHNFDMVLLEKPLCLKVGSKRFRLYQPTIGKLMIQQEMLQEIKDEETIAEDNMVQTLITVERHRQTICELLAVYSFRDSKDCLDPFRVEDRAAEFMELETSDIATLFIAILAMPTATKLMQELGIDKENERKSRIFSAKDKAGNVVCGGVSMYGSMLDHVMERYGWSLQYVLWGITAANLQLLTADEQVSIYLTEQEQKKVNPQDLAGSDTINADDPANKAKIREILSRQNRK